MTDNQNMSIGDPLPEALGAILSNKELMEKISAIVGPAPKNGEAEASPASADAILSNPDLMTKLPEVISVLRPMMEGKGNGEKKGQTPHSNDKRTALLCALKPYLSPKRREAIDYITKIGKLGDVMKNLKL